jgi:hypothetical protein
MTDVVNNSLRLANQFPFSNAQRKAIMADKCVYKELPSIFLTLSNNVKGA